MRRLLIRNKITKEYALVSPLTTLPYPSKFWMLIGTWQTKGYHDEQNKILQKPNHSHKNNNP